MERGHLIYCNLRPDKLLKLKFSSTKKSEAYRKLWESLRDKRQSFLNVLNSLKYEEDRLYVIRKIDQLADLMVRASKHFTD